MRGLPLSSVRFIGVSATCPNLPDIGDWLECPAGCVRAFGPEYRPCRLSIVVKGYNPSKARAAFPLGFLLLSTPWAACRAGRGCPGCALCFVLWGLWLRVPLGAYGRALCLPSPLPYWAQPWALLLQLCLMLPQVDYLFEKHLGQYVLPLIQEHGQGKPVLVFCASRKGSSDTAGQVGGTARVACAPGLCCPALHRRSRISVLDPGRGEWGPPLSGKVAHLRGNS